MIIPIFQTGNGINLFSSNLSKVTKLESGRNMSSMRGLKPVLPFPAPCHLYSTEANMSYWNYSVLTCLLCIDSKLLEDQYGVPVF